MKMEHFQSDKECHCWGCHFGSRSPPAVAQWSFCCVCCWVAMFPAQPAGMAMQSLTDIRLHYALPEEVWTSFIQQIGDPGNDLKLLGSLPAPVIGAALERARLHDGTALTAVQASHVGLVYSLTRRILHTAAGGDWDRWTETSPFGNSRPPPEPAPQVQAAPDRKLKMTNVLDQGDDGDFNVEGEDMKARWYQNYLQAMGGWPMEEEEPSIEQLSALHRRINIQDIAPYTDFAIYVPYGQKAARASNYRTHVLTANGYTTKELPGPASFVQWRACYRVLRTSLIMLDAVGLSNLHSYEMLIERLTRLYPSAWHLIYSADELARSAHSNRIRSKVRMEERAGKPPPPTWDPHRPWDFVFGMLVLDAEFWQAQVHGPALVWLAAGSKGIPRTPAEQVAAECLQGGMDAITPALESSRNKGTSSGAGPTDSPPGRRTQARRDARKRKAAAVKEELSQLRAAKNSQDKRGNPNSKQKCYSWNNGNSPCGDLQPGQACVAKIAREHKCTICESPGHPLRTCPNKKKG